MPQQYRSESSLETATEVTQSKPRGRGKGNRKERGRESAPLRAVGEGAIGSGARTLDEQGQCLNDRNFCFLKQQK